MNTKEVSYLGEIWKDIKNYEDEYEVSNLGRVRNKKTKRILKPFLNNGGYQIVHLCKNGKSKNYSVHRLVYEAFIGEIPEGMQVNHKDENKQNNILSNIDTLMTPKQNSNYGTHNERMAKSKSKPVIQKTLQGEVVKIWPSTREIQRQLGYGQGYISDCCRGGYYRKGKWYNLTQVNGYKWEYKKATA